MEIETSDRTIDILVSVITSLLLGLVIVGSHSVAETPTVTRGLVHQALAPMDNTGWAAPRHNAIVALRKLGPPAVRYLFEYLDAFSRPYSPEALWAGGIAAGVFAGTPASVQKEMRILLAKSSQLSKLSVVWSDPGYDLLMELADDRDPLVRKAAWTVLEQKLDPAPARRLRAIRGKGAR